MEAISNPSYCGMLLKGLKYFAVGSFDPVASEHSVNKTQFVIHIASWVILEMCLLGGVIDGSSSDESVLSFAVLGNMGLSMMKFAMISLNRNALHKFIKLIDVDAIILTKTDVFVKKAVKDIAVTLRSYMFVAVLTGLVYMVSPLFKPQSQKTETKYWEIVHVHVPSDIIVFERIGVARFIITMTLLYHVYTQIFLDIVFVSLFTHVGWQFEAASDQFKNVSYSDNHVENRSVPNAHSIGFIGYCGAFYVTGVIELNETYSLSPQDRLKEVIDYHQLILGYADNLQKMFNRVFLAQLFVSCLPICFSMILFVHAIKTAEGSLLEAISYLSLSIVVTFQLFLYTRCADLTKDRALLVSEGIYLSDWHLASPSMRRDLICVLMRAQRPISFSAMGIFPISVDTFSQIMRSVYGAFSLMTSMA